MNDVNLKIEYFHRTISQSGSAFAFWATQFLPRMAADGFAKELGCKTEDSKSLVECLRSKTVDEIAVVSKAMMQNVSFVSIFE